MILGPEGIKAVLRWDRSYPALEGLDHWDKRRTELETPSNATVCIYCRSLDTHPTATSSISTWKIALVPGDYQP